MPGSVFSLVPARIWDIMVIGVIEIETDGRSTAKRAPAFCALCVMGNALSWWLQSVFPLIYHLLSQVILKTEKNELWPQPFKPTQTSGGCHCSSKAIGEGRVKAQGGNYCPWIYSLDLLKSLMESSLGNLHPLLGSQEPLSRVANRLPGRQAFYLKEGIPSVLLKMLLSYRGHLQTWLVFCNKGPEWSPSYDKYIMYCQQVNCSYLGLLPWLMLKAVFGR